MRLRIIFINIQVFRISASYHIDIDIHYGSLVLEAFYFYLTDRVMTHSDSTNTDTTSFL